MKTTTTIRTNQDTKERVLAKSWANTYLADGCGIAHATDAMSAAGCPGTLITLTVRYMTKG